MRFRHQRPSQYTHTYMSIEDIAKFIRKSAPYVSKKCKELVEDHKKLSAQNSQPQNNAAVFAQYHPKEKQDFN